VSTNRVPSSDNPSEGAVMSCTVPEEAQQIVRLAAEPAVPGESVKSAIGRAARALGLTYARARGLWYRQARLISAEEADALRLARMQLNRQRAARIRAELAVLEAEEFSHEKALEKGLGRPDLDGRAPDRCGRMVPEEGTHAA
jgi:transposase-like protein